MEKYITLILLLVSIDIFSQVNTEYVQNAINKTDLKTYIEKLSSSSLEGRLTGSTGQRKAAEFIANRFQSLGLKIFDEDYYQKFRLIQTYWGDVYLKTNGKKLMNFEEMAFLGNIAQNNEAEKEIVFGGNGEEDQLNQINVENKVVLIFINNLRAAYEINLRLQKKNAFAVILANPKNYKQFESLKNTFKEHKLRKRLSFPSSDTTLHTASMTLNEFIIPNSRIKEIMGLSSKSLEKLVINNTIAECPSSTIAIKCERISHTLETENVIGVIEGTSNKSIILSAHYDHLGLLKEGYYPGADDNASGTASLIELAEAFSYSTDLYYNLIFLATTGEEEGLLGSKYFVSTKDFDPT